LKKARLAITILFVGFLVAVSGGSLIQKDRDFSPNENRYLAEPPEFSLDNLRSGKFQDDLEDYLRDQICFRDSWITVKTGIQKACGNTDIGGAYVGSDGYDFEKITPEDVDDKQFTRNIRAVTDYFDVASQTIDRERLSFLLVPTSGLVMADKLPKNARLFDQSQYIAQVGEAMADYNFIDVQQELIDHKDEYIYYRTDHHWTTDGAYLAYEKWCTSTGHICEDLQNLSKNIVSENFRGSLYSKILDADSAYDSIWTYAQADVAVTFDQKETADSCYDASKLEEKDQYAYFFGGNYGEVHIEGTADRGENLLVVKDSFANSFVPFLVQDYDNIYMIDLRYYNGDLEAYLQEYEITDVLVLYNISNFISDRNLYKLTGGI
jgi:hypothetical protein